MTFVSSSRKVQYDLRPAKQTERRMLVEMLQILAEAGFPIRDYRYTGMGAIHFIDFILFHRLLGITKLVSVEKEASLESRIYFNKPFEAVTPKITTMGDELLTLSKDENHIVWIDYDYVIDRSQLQDIAYACAELPPQSIVLVTVDAEPPGGSSPFDWMDHFLAQADEYLERPVVPENFTKDKMASQCLRCVVGAMEKAVVQRQNVEVIPLCNFEYSDGHRMITVGAMLGSKTDRRCVARSGLHETCYYRANFTSPPCVIDVPLLTRRERVLLDSYMPCQAGWSPKEFEMDPTMVAEYRRIYRYLPSYGELLW